LNRALSGLEDMSDADTATFSRAIGRILDAVLPRHCICCGSVSGDSNLCPPCRAELPRIRHPCRLCGAALSVNTDSICGACLKRAPPWQCGVTGLDYRFPVDQLVCRFKFKRDFACGQVLARELLRAIRASRESLPDVIVPVPLHYRRHFTRSFNQAGYVARILGKSLGIPVDTGSLRRIRNTLAQSGLDASGRRKNLRGAFRCPDLPNVHRALVDDVLTTGTTLAECSRTVRRAGASRVSVWAAARASPALR